MFLQSTHHRPAPPPAPTHLEPHKALAAVAALDADHHRQQRLQHAVLPHAHCRTHRAPLEGRPALWTHSRQGGEKNGFRRWATRCSTRMRCSTHLPPCAPLTIKVWRPALLHRLAPLPRSKVRVRRALGQGGRGPAAGGGTGAADRDAHRHAAGCGLRPQCQASRGSRETALRALQERRRGRAPGERVRDLSGGGSLQQAATALSKRPLDAPCLSYARRSWLGARHQRAAGRASSSGPEVRHIAAALVADVIRMMQGEGMNRGKTGGSRLTAGHPPGYVAAPCHMAASRAAAASMRLARSIGPRCLELLHLT